MSIVHNKILLFSVFAVIMLAFCVPVNSPKADEGQVSIDIDYIHTQWGKWMLGVHWGHELIPLKIHKFSVTIPKS